MYTAIQLKEKILLAVAAAWAVLMPIHTLVYAVLALVSMDLLTGLWKAYKAKEPITSHKLRESLAKTIGYMLALLAGFACDRILGTEDPTVARVAGVSVALIELTSINENMRAVGVDVLGAVIDRLKPTKKPE